ncbi:lysis protein [Pantoea vagans]|uniref:lysis protein n=1 Tax=Pantoea vagans TaxID=470934 RepID=UPI00059C6FCE|nr:lysis protein [Pantoea vagans]
MTRLLLISIAVVMCLTCAGLLALHYHEQAVTFESQRDKVKEQLRLANDTIINLQMRQRDVAALDAKYTKELAEAKAGLDSLQQCVSSGKCRLHLNATCPRGEATVTAGLDVAASPGLTDAAQRNYFILRERISLAGKQIEGLQQYIKEQCLR